MKQYNAVAIHFHQQDIISTYLRWTILPADQEMVGEIGLFAFYALRVLSNLGPNTTSAQLAQNLLVVAQNIDAWCDADNDIGFTLISFPGHPGRRSFYCSFGWTNDAPRTSFRTNGFGFFAKGMGYYGPVSVLAFARSLIVNRYDNRKYRYAVASVLQFVAQMYRSNKLTLGNNNQLALMAMGMCSDLDGGLTNEVETAQFESEQSQPGFPAATD
jgi:hypothetical protein